MKVTAKEIAKRLNISEATVSLVLRNRPGISEDTRSLVLSTAAEMGYTNPYSTSKKQIQFVLYKKHGNIVGEHAFFSKLTESIVSEASKRNYDVLISYFYESQNVFEQIKSIKTSGCCGIILLATEMHPCDFEPFCTLNIPLIVIDSYFPNKEFDTIAINNYQGARRAVEYLISKGHTEIGYLSSSNSIRNFKERFEGYLSGIKNISVINNSRSSIVKVSPIAEETELDMISYLSKSPSLPTAFFADNDLIALACSKALQSFGIKIPEDISIIGFDGIPACELFDPPLTTMNVPKEQFGISAVSRLDELIKNQAKGVIKIEICTKIVERGSVKDIRR